MMQSNEQLQQENKNLREEIKELEKELRAAYRDMYNAEDLLSSCSTFGLHDNY